MTENNREKRTNQMSKTKCHRITTVSVLIEYMGDRSVVAFDFETASDANRDKEKAALAPAKSHIVGCSYVPITHTTGKNVDEEDFFSFLQDFIKYRGIDAQKMISRYDYVDF